MKFKSITPICCLLILFCAAQNSLFAQNKAEAIDVAGALENNDVVNMTEYFSSIDYIPLGEGEVWVPEATSCNIFYADKENFYLTFGERKNRGCFKFTGEGKYVTSFVEKGTWTHEFINVSDITACKENGNIALCDNNKIVIFSSDGKWITTLFVYHLLGEAGCVRDIYFEGPNRVRFLWYQESLNRVSVICMDLKGNLLHRKVLKSSTSEGTSSAFLQIPEFDGELKQFSQYCDTVYAVDGEFNTLSAKYILNFGEYKKGKKLSGQILKNVCLLVNRNIIETDNFIILEILFPLYSNKGIEQHRIIDKILYDKNTKKTTLLRFYDALDIRAEGFNNNIDGGAPFLPSYMIGNKMYQFIDAAKFIDLAGKCRSAKMKEVASGLTAKSNPVMVVAKLK